MSGLACSENNMSSIALPTRLLNIDSVRIKVGEVSRIYEYIQRFEVDSALTAPSKLPWQTWQILTARVKCCRGVREGLSTYAI